MSLIERLQRDCEYDPEGDSPVDALIGYKDALEDHVGGIEATLEKLIAEAVEVMDGDDAYWEATASGQDTEEAEASGALAGQVGGLRAALALVQRGEESARAALDLHTDPDRAKVVERYRARMQADG